MKRILKAIDFKAVSFFKGWDYDKYIKTLSVEELQDMVKNPLKEKTIAYIETDAHIVRATFVPSAADSLQVNISCIFHVDDVNPSNEQEKLAELYAKAIRVIDLGAVRKVIEPKLKAINEDISFEFTSSRSMNSVFKQHPYEIVFKDNQSSSIKVSEKEVYYMLEKNEQNSFSGLVILSDSRLGFKLSSHLYPDGRYLICSLDNMDMSTILEDKWNKEDASEIKEGDGKYE